MASIVVVKAAFYLYWVQCQLIRNRFKCFVTKLFQHLTCNIYIYNYIVL